MSKTDTLTSTYPVPEGYPRPQFEREQWQNLSGPWDFCFDDQKRGRRDGWYEANNFGGAGTDDPVMVRTIQVPYTYESLASGIHEEEAHESVWYKRQFELTEEEVGEDRCVILNFEGSDYETQVWLNGQHIGTEFGGQHRFSFDLSPYVRAGANDLVVEAQDDYDPAKARGKQRWVPENFGCWYTQTTGIWKTVWLETHHRSYIRDHRQRGIFGEDSLQLDFTVADAPVGGSLRARLSFGGQLIVEQATSFTEEAYPGGVARPQLTLPLASTKLGPWQVHTWTPENPALYDLEFELLDAAGNSLDRVRSYYGHRMLEYREDGFYLNGVKYYQKLILDQGYWEDTLLTCPGDEAILHDLSYLKEAGFNGLRKHQKVEDERFIYFCDKLGLLVWSEFAANYVFRPDGVQAFTEEWIKVVRQMQNHPSIVTWTPFNESWGVPEIHWQIEQQAWTRGIYDLTHALDPERAVISNDGWEHTFSDILTLHDYEEDADRFFERYIDPEPILNDEIQFNRARFAFAEDHEYDGEPVILSEYGGIAFATEGDQWGYGRNVKDLCAFEARLGALHDAIAECSWISGVCYTQLTDVEQEVNGLLKMNHEVKIPAEVMRRLMARLDGQAEATEATEE